MPSKSPRALSSRPARVAAAVLALAAMARCSGAHPGDDADVTVSPGSVSLEPGARQAFTAAVAAATGPAAVTWSIRESGGGTVSGSGLYTAPSVEGTFHVVATSVMDPTKSGAATVTVTAPPVTVTVAPATARLEPGQTQQFTASVANTANATVTWTVQEGAAGGAVGSSGLYTAPSTPGTYHVIAASVVDPTAIASAQVVVAAPGTCAVDACPATNGLTWACEKRFAFGTNWAWRNWSLDFGSSVGVSKASSSFSSGMAAMRARGVSVIRWWMFPRLSTPGITWGADGAPSGVTAGLIADVNEALRLAEVNDVYLMLTPFSFDTFKTGANAGDSAPSIQPMVIDATKRAKLLANLVKPIAAAVAASPYRDRVIAWDMINEPEWVVTGSDPYGDPPFEPQSDVQRVTFAQMETFLTEMASTLHQYGSGLVSVGGAAIKWPKAWTRVGVDFYQLHYYDWVYQWFPYTTVTLKSVGLTDKPVVMGEYPNTGLSAVGGLPALTASQFAAKLVTAGYAGGLTWQYVNSDWSQSDLQVFAASHTCDARF